MSRKDAKTQVSPGDQFGLDERQIAWISRRLLTWGRKNFKDYPWRSELDPWLSFLAEFLLQRTRANQVEPVFREAREKYPTAESLVSGGQEASRTITDRLGLHRRGPLLTKIAAAVAARGGSPPETIEELRQLTGVGMYTAAAWLSLHRGMRAVIIDSNVARWLSRMTGQPYDRDPRNVKWVQELADHLTPRRVFRDYNYAVLDFTMHVCVPRTPRCGVCPVQSVCSFGGGSSTRRAPQSKDKISRLKPPMERRSYPRINGDRYSPKPASH